VRIYLFLRSIVWTSVLSVVSIVASLISAFIAPNLSLAFGLASIALATLSPRRSDY
jgi:hypothetical protein